jgi:biopolymer transport protein ExbD
VAEKRRFLDIWIIESNTVYKEVPYAVVTDWVQQGRLLENDMWKPSGTREWFRLGGAADLKPYFPRAETNRPQDQAEALEPVHIDFAYKRPREEEDEDVDMIPLIDVSLVLLVFFMLTATGVSLAAFVKPPETENATITENKEGLRLDIAVDKEDGKTPLYSVAVGNKRAEDDERDLHTLSAALDRLKIRVSKEQGPVEVVINADRELPSRVVRNALLGLRADAFRDKVRATFYGASQREP